MFIPLHYCPSYYQLFANFSPLWCKSLEYKNDINPTINLKINYLKFKISNASDETCGLIQYLNYLKISSSFSKNQNYLKNEIYFKIWIK